MASQSAGNATTIPPFHPGDFCWDNKALKRSINLTKPDYDECDPRTWPLFTLNHMKKTLGEDYTGSGPTLPPRCAYAVEAFRKYITKHPSLSPGLFGDYPFNVTQYGEMRNSARLNAAELATWLRNWGGSEQQLSQKAQSEDQSGGNNDNRDVSPSENAYDQVMKMLSDKKVLIATALGKKNVELADGQTKLAKEKTRADTAEARLKTLEAQLADQKRKAVSAEAELTNDRQNFAQLIDKTDKQILEQAQRANAAEQKVNALQKAFKELNAQLAAKEKEAADVKQQVLNIWAEMKRLDGTELVKTSLTAEKRKITDIGGIALKKTKISHTPAPDEDDVKFRPLFKTAG